MPDVGGVLGDERQMACLPRGLLHLAGDRSTQGLVVYKNRETAALVAVAEMLDGEVQGEELPIDSTVLPLRRGQLLREKGKWLVVRPRCPDPGSTKPLPRQCPTRLW